MRFKQHRKLNPLIAVALSVVTVFTVAVCLVQGTMAETAKIVWNGETDRAAAVEIAAAPNTTRKNASGTKIPSNAHSADFPGIYFIWDSKQKDNGYLKVNAGLFNARGSFTLTAKESKTYWDFVIAPQSGQGITDDGCYVFFIPKAYGNKNINMVFIDEAKPVAVTTQPAATTTAPAFSVATGEWESFSNFFVRVVGSSYTGDFGSAVVEAGIRYAFEDPAMASPMWSTASAGSPFAVWLPGIVNGAWYYAAYVKTADGDYFFGEVKMAIYP